ncbi:MAG: pyridoxamine 5'-phosphate oxidase family protein [Pseudomonadota bacterium]
MSWVMSLDQLDQLYGQPGDASLIKVAAQITPEYGAWIAASRLCVLSTVGPDGTDASPRGDDGPVVRVADPKTLLMPDWRGNNRCDSLRNIVQDGRMSLMFVVRGSNNVIRVNGTARLSVDPDLLASFAFSGHSPRSVIVMTVGEVYSQCARALMRANVWDGTDDSGGLPSMGDILKAQKAGFDARTYDREWAARAAKTLWSDPAS